VGSIPETVGGRFPGPNFGRKDLRGPAHSPDNGGLGLRHAHRSGAHDRDVLFSRTLDGRHRVATVVANQVQNVDAVQLATLAIRIVVLTTGEQSNECSQTHAHLHGNFLAGLWAPNYWLFVLLGRKSLLSAGFFSGSAQPIAGQGPE